MKSFSLLDKAAIVLATMLFACSAESQEQTSALDINKALEPCEIRYPARTNAMYPFGSYPKMLLQAAISVTSKEYGNCRLSHVGSYSQKRKVTSLLNNDGVDVVWLPATKDLSARLRHVSVPIRKGLLGWRLFLIHEDNNLDIASLTDLESLKTLSIGYGADWSDLEAMEANFPQIMTSSNYEALFQMLAYKRFDAFPRAVHEAEPEILYHKEQFPMLKIADSIAMHYKQVDLFYVNRSNKKLHERLTKGLMMLIEDGTFERLFMRYHKRHIKNAKLNNRTIIQLNNPKMPEDVLFENDVLWFSPKDYQ